MNRRILIGLIVVLVVCLALAIAGATLLLLQPARVTGPVAINVSPTDRVASDVTVPPETPLPTVSNYTADELANTQIPERNLYQIVPRLRKDLSLLTPVPTPVAETRHAGDTHSFFVVQDATTGTYRRVSATLQAITPHSYFWVEDGLTFDKTQLQNSADFFENSIYPTDHKYFGTEASPGPDGDVHINVLTTRFQDAAGYFSSEDTYPRSIVPYSNQCNIFYMNIDVRIGSQEYLADMAHEFQHLIHSYEAQHDAGWINEGMSMLAEKLNGFEVGNILRLFGQNPDTQLNTWATDPQAAGAHYAASYLFFDYTAQRFGPDFTRDVIHAPREGIPGIQTVLDQRAPGQTFDNLFSDWAITNYVNDSKIDDGKYGYANETFRVANQPDISQYPVSQTVPMQEYSASYFGLEPATTSADVTVYFTGTTTAKLLPVDAHSGRWMWYSNRADLADMTLTRSVDLSQVNQASLHFWTWYDIEKDFDYAYVEVSSDGGKTWDILPGKYTTTSNPNGASYGPAYTGKSGVSDSKSNASAQWVQEQMDLSPYAGKVVLLRFEYITDDAFNAPSFAVDDISIPEIGFTDDVESGKGDWNAEGFIRTDNVLPQNYVVSVVESGTNTQIMSMPLDDQNRGHLTISGFGKNVTHAELVVTAEAPTTTETTEYQFAAVPQ